MSHSSPIDRYATPIGILGTACLVGTVLWLGSFISDDPTEAPTYDVEAREALLETITDAGERKLKPGTPDGVKIPMEAAAKLVQLKAAEGEPVFEPAPEAAGAPTASSGLTVDPRYPLAEIPPIDDNPARNAELVALAQNAEKVEEGELNFQALCMQCHGDPKLAGDNPTVIFDDRWFYVETPSQIEQLLYKGILEKGMPPWEGVLTPEMSSTIVAYILANLRE